MVRLLTLEQKGCNMEEQNEVMNPYMEEIFKEMFKRVGVEYDPVYMEQDDWYCNELWTTEDENDFCRWMFNYLHDNQEALQSLFGTDDIDEDSLKEAIGMFVLDFGWDLIDFTPEFEGEDDEVQ